MDNSFPEPPAAMNTESYNHYIIMDNSPVAMINTKSYDQCIMDNSSEPPAVMNTKTYIHHIMPISSCTIHCLNHL